MNVFNKVTLKSLKKNKTRTIVTIIGIVLSSAMICAVTTFASSLYNYALQNAIYVDGDWHASAFDTDFDTCKDIMDNKQVDKTASAQHIGYSRLEECDNEYKPYIYVMGVCDDFEKTMPVHITRGNYPTSVDEILLPEHLHENGGIIYSIGSLITLDIGKRTLDNCQLNQYNPCYTYDENGDSVLNNETLAIEFTKTYKVVGFYERPSFEEYTAPGYTALTLAHGGDFRYDIWFRMKNAKDVYEFVEQNQFGGTFNGSVLRYSGVSRYSGFNSMLTSLAAIVILLIMFGSISLIYNAFSISVAERTKQFGLLSSIGATKKQLRKMVLSEALMVSAVGIPLGILSGVGGIAITLLIIGHKFESIIGFPLPLRVNVSLISIIIAVVVSLLTVLLSAVIPSVRATRVSAIEAIRQSKDINVKAKNIRTPKLLYKFFGLPGMLANKYYKRSRKKYRSTIISLFMSIVLFVSASAFTENLTKAVDDSYGAVKYDISLYAYESEHNGITPDKLLSELKKDDALKKIAYGIGLSFQASLSTSDANKEYIEYYKDETDKSDRVDVHTNIKFIDDDSFIQLLENNSLDKSDYFDKSAPLAVAVDGKTLFDEDIGKYTSYSVLKNTRTDMVVTTTKDIEGYYLSDAYTDDNGERMLVYLNFNNEDDVMTVKESDISVEYPLSVSGVIYDAPFYTDVNSRLTLIYPYSMRDLVFESDYFKDAFVSYYIITDDHVKTSEHIKDTMYDLGLSDFRSVNEAADEDQQRSIVTIIRVFAYGFIVLISLIAAANVFNTISTNINLRRREFAMLKSVGMTSKGFNRMMNYECVLYGTRALLLGIPVSVGISYLIHLAMLEGYQKQFLPPVSAICVSAFSVFIVVFITMMYSMSKIKKDNPIDALKNENL